MVLKLAGMALGILMACDAVAGDYAVSIAENGLNEYTATDKGLRLMTGSPFQPATPVSSGSGITCTEKFAKAPASVLETDDATLLYGVYLPCGANAVLMEYGVTGHGLYERYRDSTARIGGLGNHEPLLQSMAIGAHNSLILLVGTPEAPSNNEALVYNNELQLLATLPGLFDKTGGRQEVLSVKLDPNGAYVYVCTSGVNGDAVTQLAWKTATNPLLHPQLVLPVPYTEVSQSYDPLIFSAYCL